MYVLRKGLGNMGSILTLLHLMTFTTWPSFTGGVLDGLFPEQDQAEASSLVSLLF